MGRGSGISRLLLLYILLRIIIYNLREKPDDQRDNIVKIDNSTLLYNGYCVHGNIIFAEGFDPDRITQVVHLSSDYLDDRLMEQIDQLKSRPELHKLVSIHIFYDSRLNPQCDIGVLQSTTIKSVVFELSGSCAFHSSIRDISSYPVNIARNVGRMFTKTKFILIADLEHLFSHNFESTVRKIAQRVLLRHPNAVLVYRIFEIDQKIKRGPQNKRELAELLWTKEAVVFHSQYFDHHGIENLGLWIAMENSTGISQELRLRYDRLHWEPQFVSLNTIPMHDAKFPFLIRDNTVLCSYINKICDGASLLVIFDTYRNDIALGAMSSWISIPSSRQRFYVSSWNQDEAKPQDGKSSTIQSQKISFLQSQWLRKMKLTSQTLSQNIISHQIGEPQFSWRVVIYRLAECAIVCKLYGTTVGEVPLMSALHNRDMFFRRMIFPFRLQSVHYGIYWIRIEVVLLLLLFVIYFQPTPSIVGEVANDINPSEDKEEYMAEKPNTTIIVVTPTYRRATRVPDMIRMAQTLQHVSNLHWIVIEDGERLSTPVAGILLRSGTRYVYLLTKRTRGMPKRGWSHRDFALRYIREFYKDHPNPAVVYFADDDNTYDTRLFNEYIRNVKRIGFWAVGLAGGSKVETPIIQDKQIVGWNVFWRPDREFATDMAGFAINLNEIMRVPNATFGNVVEFWTLGPETHFIKQFGIDKSEAEAFGCEGDRKEILVYHTKTLNPITNGSSHGYVVE